MPILYFYTTCDLCQLKKVYLHQGYFLLSNMNYIM